MRKDKGNPQRMLENRWETARLRRLPRTVYAGNARAAVPLQVWLSGIARVRAQDVDACTSEDLEMCLCVCFLR